MAQKFANAARAYLASGIINTDTTITVTTGGGALFPEVVAPDFARAVLQDANGIEIVLITAHTAGSDSFTVTRAQEGTTARTFASGSVFGIRITSADIEAALAGGGIAYAVKTANYTIAHNEGVIANTSGGSFTITLPASPSAGDQVFIADGASFATNALTVARNGSTIEGAAEDLVLDVVGVNVQLIYTGSTWQVYAQAGLATGTAATTGKAIAMAIVFG